MRQPEPEPGPFRLGGTPIRRVGLRGCGKGFTPTVVRRAEAVLRRPQVAERLGRLALQGGLAAVLLVVGLAVRYLPGTAGARAAMGQAWTRDYTVRDGQQALDAWARARGGWAPALAQLARDVRTRAQAQIEPLLAVARPSQPAAPPATSRGPGSAPAPGAGTPAGAAKPAPVPGGAPATPASPPRSRPPAGATPGQPAGAGQTGTTGEAALITFNRPTEVPAGKTVRPVPGKVLVEYGWITAGAEEHFHHGVDLAAREGQEVRVLRAGTVRRVGTGDPDRSGSGRNLGRFVEIEHSDGLLSRYAPLTDLRVKEGDRVEAGQVIGRVAAPPPAEPGTPHLHLEVHAGGGSVDPQPFLGDGGGV